MGRIKLLDTVAEVADVPELGLSAGEVGAVVEELGGDGFEVEFVDPAGATYAIHTLRAEQLVALPTRGEALRLHAGAAQFEGLGRQPEFDPGEGLSGNVE